MERNKQGSKTKVQKGWLSPTERASVSAISLRHILASPGYAPGTIAVNVIWIKRDSMLVKRIAASTRPVSFNLQPFPSNSTRKFKSSQFQHIFAHFGLPWVRRWENCGKCYMDRKRIQCWSNASQHIPSIFNRLRAMARYWQEIATFSYPLCI